jgi:hypothetical protein
MGKSILLRKVLSELHQERNFVYVIIDGRECRDEVDLLKSICKEMCSALREEFKDDAKVLAEAAYIEDIAEKSKITKGNVVSILKGTQKKKGIEIGVLSFFKAKFGIINENTEREEVFEEYEFEVNSSFLRDLLNSVIEKLVEERELLFFLDNLDQVYEKERISEFLKLILKIKKPIMIATVRNEALSNELRRDFRRIFPLKEIDSDSLIKILRKRLDVCGKEDRGNIDEDRLFKVVDTFKELTGNPLAFLTWIDFLCNNTELNPTTALEDLGEYVKTHFADFNFKELEKISKFFLNQGNKSLEKNEILREGISEGLFNRLYERGVLVSNDIYNPINYKLAPDFAFFKELR